MKQLTEESLNEFLHWADSVQSNLPGSYNDEARAALGTVSTGPFAAEVAEILAVSSSFIPTHGLNTALFSCWCTGFMIGREMQAREQEMDAFRAREDDSCWIVTSYDGLSLTRETAGGSYVHEYTCRAATPAETGEINARRADRQASASRAVENA